MKIIFIQLVLFIGFISLIFSQQIPNELLEFKVQKLLTDAGQNWETNTMFGPHRFQSVSKTNLKKSIKFDSLNVRTWTGIFTKNGATAFYGFAQLSFKKHYYGYLYPRIFNDPDPFMRFESMERNVSRGGPNAGKKDISGIGFQNDWITLQLGTGRESWGAGNDIQLALSENSGNYDYLLLGSDYGKVRVRYIHGFLENVEQNINRYITARGLEWTNKRSFIIGFSETVIYSGEDRSMDIGYFNPMSSHLEIELNDRLNVIGDGNSNAVWQVHLDYYLNKYIRFSGNYLYDEFVIDQNIELEKEHGKAFSIRLAYTPLFSNNHLITLYSSLIYVGTPTFRHGIGTNNFVQDGRPLGWHRGSDGQDLVIGINYFNNNDLIISFSAGHFQSGEETITNRVFESYSDYLRGPFPSGQVNKTFYVETHFTYRWKEYYSLSSALHYSSNINLLDHKVSIQISQPFQ